MKPKQAELTAIQACCIDAIGKNIQGNITIYSDSSAALKSLTKCCIDSALELECIQLLQQLGANNAIKLIWLPAHANIYGNEVADKLAAEAAKRTTISPEPITALDYKLIRKTNEERLENQLAQMWRNERGCAHTKYFISHADPSIANQVINMSKSDIRIVMGLLTGHCKLNQHLARLRLRDDPDCDQCGNAIESAKHKICECDEFATIRQNLYGNTTILPENLCKFPLAKLVTFFKKCTIFHAFSKQLHKTLK